MIHWRISGAVTPAAAAAAVGLATAPATAATSGTFTATGSMNAGHTHAKATLLPDRRVLVSGDGGTRTYTTRRPAPGP